MATGYTGDARAVTSVNDEVGEVDLDADDVGADDAGTAATAVTTHAGAADPHGDRAFATTAVTTHSGATDPHGDRAYAAGIVAALSAVYLALTGGTLTGALAVQGANFSVLGTGKGYRFRPLGSRLDCEACGSDWQFSVFSDAGFTGDQRNYLRLESGTQLAHAIGRWYWATTPDAGSVILDVDPSVPGIGFYGAAAQAKKTVTGAKGSNAALTSLLTQLAALGLITDSTTA